MTRDVVMIADCRSSLIFRGQNRQPMNTNGHDGKAEQYPTVCFGAKNK